MHEHEDVHEDEDEDAHAHEHEHAHEDGPLGLAWMSDSGTGPSRRSGGEERSVNAPRR